MTSTRRSSPSPHVIGATLSDPQFGNQVRTDLLFEKTRLLLRGPVHGNEQRERSRSKVPKKRNPEMTQAIVYWLAGMGMVVLAFFEVAQAF